MGGDTLLDSAAVQMSVSPNKWTTLYQSEFSTSPVPGNWHDREVGAGWSLPPVTSEPQWVSRGVDLSPFAGKTVRIRFAFDTIDTFLNDFEGWYVDDVNVFAASSAATAPFRAFTGVPGPSGLVNPLRPGVGTVHPTTCSQTFCCSIESR
jgi:hypothetical protein